MKSYHCPVCHKVLTKKEYEKALGILKEKDIHFEHELRDVKKKLREAQSSVKRAKKEGIETERKRNKRLLEGQSRKIQALKERLKQVQKGSTPQTEGLEFEEILTKRLQKEFPQDRIEHKGHAGDVLQTAMFGTEVAGVIIYECKRAARLQNEHIEQAYRAKISRDAEFAVVVTTAIKNGTRFSIIRGVLVVSPLAVIPLANLLRVHLIEMARAKVPIKKRAKIAQELLKYIRSPEFKNPLEEVVRTTEELWLELKDEIKTHGKFWTKRVNNYQKIKWNTQLIHENVQLIMQGKKIKPISRYKPPQLPQLPPQAPPDLK